MPVKLVEHLGTWVILTNYRIYYFKAPEVMCRQNHGVAVDYYALGVCGYEFMLGKRPYKGRSR